MQTVVVQRLSPAFGRLAAIAIAALTAWCFAPVLQHEWIAWGARTNAMSASTVKGDPAGASAPIIFPVAGRPYQPAAKLSLELDRAIWGASPKGFHLTHLALHVIGALLVFGLCYRILELASRTSSRKESHAMSGAVHQGAATEGRPFVAHGSSVAAAGIAALLFTLHPQRVESIAWIDGRGNLLGDVFLLAAAWLYVRSIDGVRPSPFWLPASVFAYAASLVSSSRGILFPLVLLALSTIPRRPDRNLDKPGRWFEKLRSHGDKFGHVVAAGILGIALLVANAGTIDGSSTYASLSARTGNGVFWLAGHVLNFIRPTNLSPLHESLSPQAVWDWTTIACGAVMLAVSVFLWAVRSVIPAAFAGWAAYVICVAPGLGLLPNDALPGADSNSYAPAAMLTLTCAAILHSILKRILPSSTLRSEPQALDGAVIEFSTKTHPMKSRDLKSGTARIFPRIVAGAAVCVALIGLHRATSRRLELWSTAELFWPSVFATSPQNVEACLHMGFAALARKNWEDARSHGFVAVQGAPNDPRAYELVAKAALELSHTRELQSHAEALTRLLPNDPSGWVLLAESHVQAKRWPKAEEALNKAAALAPRIATTRHALARFLFARNRFDEAIAQWEQAVVLEPTLEDAWVRLGNARDIQSDHRGAMQAWIDGLASSPRHVGLRQRVAWIYATSPFDEVLDGLRALEMSEALLSESPKDPRNREIKAAALGRLGRFSEALSIADPLAQEKIHVDLHDRLQRASNHYRQGKPYTDHIP